VSNILVGPPKSNKHLNQSLKPLYCFQLGLVFSAIVAQIVYRRTSLRHKSVRQFIYEHVREKEPTFFFLQTCSNFHGAGEQSNGKTNFSCYKIGCFAVLQKYAHCFL